MIENKHLEQNNETMGENSFMKTLLKKRLNQKGLTLIELLAVIVILAIVAAIAIPAIGNIINDSRDKAILSDGLSIISGAKIANSAGDCGTDDVCDAGELADYVDNVTLDNASVEMDTLTLTWSGLTGFSSGSVYTVASPATEDELVTALEQ